MANFISFPRVATFTAITALILTGCFSQTSEETPEATNSAYLTFRSEALGISFEYPAEWGDAIYEDAATRSAFIMLDKQCVTQCKGLLLSASDNVDRANFLQNLEKKYAAVEAKPQTEEKNGLLAIKIEKPIELSIGGVSVFDFVLALIDEQKHLFIFRLTKNTPWRNTVAELSAEDKQKETVRRAEWKIAQPAFDHIVATFQQFAPAPQSQAGTTTPLAAPGQEHKFDSCGAVGKYASEPFFEDFKQKLTAMQRFTKPNLVEGYGTTKFRIEDIAEACRSTEGNLFIAIAPGEYCELGSVLSFNTTTKELVRADDKGARSNNCEPTLKGFGKRKGNVVEVFGEFGDAGVRANTTYHYNYNTNTLVLKKSCLKDYGATDSPVAKCTEY